MSCAVRRPSSWAGRRPARRWGLAGRRLSVITGRDGLATGPRDERSQDAEAHAGSQELDVAVRKHGVGPAGVEAVDLTVVGAVNGTRPRTRLSIKCRALRDDPIPGGLPGPPFDCLIGAGIASAPQFGPARVFGEQDGV